MRETGATVAEAVPQKPGGVHDEIKAAEPKADPKKPGGAHDEIKAAEAEADPHEEARRGARRNQGSRA